MYRGGGERVHRQVEHGVPTLLAGIVEHLENGAYLPGGRETLCNFGVAAHPTTVSNTTKEVSSTHLVNVNRVLK